MQIAVSITFAITSIFKTKMIFTIFKTWNFRDLKIERKIVILLCKMIQKIFRNQ